MSKIDSFLVAWTEAERNGDVPALEALLTDDFVGVGPLGFMLSKPAWLARHQQGLTYETFEVDEVQKRVHAGTALVNARQNVRGAYHGNPIPEAVRTSLTLVDEGGSCRMAGIHMSFIAGTPGAPPVPGGRTGGEQR